jgi:hypothetical protein
MLKIDKHKYGAVAIEGYLYFARVVLCKKWLATAKLIEDVLPFFLTISFFRSALPTQDDKSMILAEITCLRQ